MEPTTKPKTTAKDFFLYLFALVLLYISVGSLISMLFDYIDYLYPDALGGYYDFYSSGMRMAIATLIILFPLLVVATFYINRDLRDNPEKQEIGIRKWLLFLTLFLAAGFLIGDLVTLVNTFLNGEITTRFILKVLSVLLVAGYVLAYYVLDLRGVYLRNAKLGHLMGIIASIVVAVVLIGGFIVVGSPASQRLARFDAQKVTDLQGIQSEIVYSFWQQKGRLPKDLSELNDPISGFKIPRDPQSGEMYTYEPGEGLSFKLCATFNKETTSLQGEQIMYAAYPISNTNESWKHGSGKTCFERTIDPELYPPMTKK